jgi:predicted DNA binding CopG/RHH family protein
MKAEEFDEKFEADEDLTELMDFSTARRSNRKKQVIELKLPLWMIRQLETEAQKQGISLQAFLENYLHENLTPAKR